MIVEILQAIIDDPAIRRLMGRYDHKGRSQVNIDEFMDEMNLNAEQRQKVREAYQNYNNNQERYQYKYAPKSDDPFDKFDAYFRKYEDMAEENEKRFGHEKAYAHRKYQQYAGGQQQKNNYQQYDPSYLRTEEERKHYEVLEIPVGSDFDKIKIAYKSAMKKYHPDRFPNDEEKKKHAEEISRKINGAYEYFKKKFNKN
jgi:DnaJ-domain-containing protein 1